MTADTLSATFAALSDPTRRAILVRLSAGEASVKELAEPFAISLPAITKHLKVLQRAGIVRQGRQAQFRPCRLEATPLAEAADWIQQYRRFWDARLDRLEAYLAEIQSEGNQGGDTKDTAGDHAPAALARPAKKRRPAPKKHSARHRR